MKMLKHGLLIGLLGIIGTLAMAADIVPLIKQFTLPDSDGNKWILTVTAIDGKFPSDMAIIDGNCASFLIRDQQSQYNTIDLLTPGIVTKLHTLDAQGLIETGYHNNDVQANTNLNSGEAPLQIELNSRLGTTIRVPVTLHIIYQ